MNSNLTNNSSNNGNVSNLLSTAHLEQMIDNAHDQCEYLHQIPGMVLREFYLSLTPEQQANPVLLLNFADLVGNYLHDIQFEVIYG